MALVVSVAPMDPASLVLPSIPATTIRGTWRNNFLMKSRCTMLRFSEDPCLLIRASVIKDKHALLYHRRLILIPTRRPASRSSCRILATTPLQEDFLRENWSRYCVIIFWIYNHSNWFQGSLRVNQRNYEESYVDNPDGDDQADLLILGVHDRNRALQSDVVVVRTKSRENWVVSTCTVFQIYAMSWTISNKSFWGTRWPLQRMETRKAEHV